MEYRQQKRYLAGSSARDVGNGGRAGHDGEGAGSGGSDASQLAEGGTGNEAHCGYLVYVFVGRVELRGERD